MPEFFAEHVPDDLDEFTTGYLETAEWLIDEEVDRSKIRGFTKAAINDARVVCEDFQKANAAELERYQEVTGRDMSSAGMDFWLTRNHHGAGFWDRGDDPVLESLTDAAHAYGECDVSVWRGWIYLS